MNSSKSKISYHVILIGDTEVGKTCLALQIRDGRFDETALSTVGATCMPIELEYNHTPVSISLYDTAGQEKYRSMTPYYFRGGHLIIIVFDITSMRSFQNVDTWLQLIMQSTNEIQKFILVGNKTDLENKREVTMVDAQRFAEEKGFSAYIETSCKSGIAIDDLKYKICEEIIDLRSSELPKTTNLQQRRPSESNDCC